MIAYTGVNVVNGKMERAKRKYPEQTFINHDFVAWKLDGKYDYVVASGMLTQKFCESTLAKNKYAKALIIKMFETSQIAIFFNVMGWHFNFQKENLYYRRPAEMLAWCMSYVILHARLNSHYTAWHEDTISLFRGCNT